MIKVYFDGVCKYCSKEIKYYKRIAPENSFQWINVADNPHAMSSYGITQSEALLFLHAVDSAGKIYVGSEAFALIWKSLPRWKALGYLISMPVIKTLTKWCYIWFAKRRFNSYSHCRLASKTLKDI